MRIPALALQASVAAAIALLATGCVIEERTSYRHDDRDREVVVANPPPPAPPAPQPVYVDPPPPPPPQGVVVYQAAPEPPQAIVIRRAPPPPREEIRPRAPGHDFVWLGGYWSLYRNQWVWVQGHWERPPHPGARWEPHHWEQHGAQFEFRVGGWR